MRWQALEWRGKRERERVGRLILEAELVFLGTPLSVGLNKVASLSACAETEPIHLVEIRYVDKVEM